MLDTMERLCCTLKAQRIKSCRKDASQEKRRSELEWGLQMTRLLFASLPRLLQSQGAHAGSQAYMGKPLESSGAPVQLQVRHVVEEVQLSILVCQRMQVWVRCRESQR